MSDDRDNMTVILPPQSAICTQIDFEDVVVEVC
jgi:hypothetical protein